MVSEQDYRENVLDGWRATDSVDQRDSDLRSVAFEGMAPVSTLRDMMTLVDYPTHEDLSIDKMITKLQEYLRTTYTPREVDDMLSFVYKYYSISRGLILRMIRRVSDTTAEWFDVTEVKLVAEILKRIQLAIDNSAPLPQQSVPAKPMMTSAADVARSFL